MIQASVLFRERPRGLECRADIICGLASLGISCE